MTQTFKEAVIETLLDRRLEAINFGYRGSFVYQSGFHDIARLVRDGHIRFAYSGVGSNSFEVDAAAGTPHTWSVNRDIAIAGPQDQIMIRGTLGPGGRGTIVHEATHALQDYQRLNDADRLGSQFSAENAEGAAYIAGWMARLLWGWPRPQQQDSMHGTQAFAKRVAHELLEHNIDPPIVPSGIAAILDGYASHSIGSRERYAFHGFF